MSTRTLAATLLGVGLLVGGGYGLHVYRNQNGQAGAATSACPHTLAAADCPFCTPSLLETKGFCGGHGVPEAICTRCHKDVIPAFKAKGDWCAEHTLPESQCITCDPALADKLKRPATTSGGHGEGALCAHGVSSATCFVCSPGLIEQGGACAEHGVLEVLCTRCNAGLIPAFKATYDWCAEHEVPESQCVTCNPRLAAAAPPPPPALTSPEERQRSEPRFGCRKETQRIELASADLARKVGIATTPVVRAPFRDLVTVSAELAYRADRRAEVSSRAPGVVREVRAELGQWVEEGAVLALVDSPDLGTARSDLAAAVTLLELWERNHAREVELASSGVGTRRPAIDADTRRTEAAVEVTRAEQRLRNLGLSVEQILDARRGGAVDSTLPVRAPFAGAVVVRDAVQGKVTSAGERLLTIVDTRTLWAILDVPEEAVARLRPDSAIVFTTQALRGEQFVGHVTWIATEIDRRTRTLKAHAELENPDGRLKANAFGAVEVTLGDSRNALLVPIDAVQWEGCCNVVFVPTGDRAFMPRKVTLGGATGTHVEVLRGLEASDVVVSVGAFILKTELLKGSIGAGCCAADK